MERIPQITVPNDHPPLLIDHGAVIEEFRVHSVTADTMQPTSVIRRFHTINPFDPDAEPVVMRNTCEVVFFAPCGHAECPGGGRHVMHLN